LQQNNGYVHAKGSTWMTVSEDSFIPPTLKKLELKGHLLGSALLMDNIKKVNNKLAKSVTLGTLQVDGIDGSNRTRSCRTLYGDAYLIPMRLCRLSDSGCVITAAEVGISLPKHHPICFL